MHEISNAAVHRTLRDKAAQRRRPPRQASQSASVCAPEHHVAARFTRAYQDRSQAKGQGDSRKGWRIFHGRPTRFVANIPTA